MPELPDILLYLHALRPRIVGRRVQGVRLASPFLLRSIDPPLSAIEGRTVMNLHRLGKRVVIEAERELFLVFHLMIAGRFRWKDPGAKIPGKIGLFAIDFEHGTLILTEAGSKRQASLHLVTGRAGLADHDRGGLDVLDATLPAFTEALQRENHTLKRALTDQELRQLFDATRATLSHWVSTLREEAGDAFPEKVTAFRDGMAVHGKYGQPCPDCGAPVQRVVYAANEAN